MKFLYSIKTRDGRQFETEAESAVEALKNVGVEQAECRPFYPFPRHRVLTEAERIRRAARYAKLHTAFKSERPIVRVVGKGKIETV